MIERRKYARLNVDANVRYRIIGGKTKNSESAECSNISPEGLCLTFQDAVNIKIGTRLEIELELKNSKLFTMIGEIIWVKNGKAGTGNAKTKITAGVRISEIYNDDENRFLLQLCDRMVQKLNKDFPTAKS